jgi:hypothetical protein
MPDIEGDEQRSPAGCIGGHDCQLIPDRSLGL